VITVNFVKKLQDRHGLASVTAVFMLLLMLAAITSLVTVFYQSNVSAQQQMQAEHERSQEQIIVTDQFIENNVQYVTVANTGPVDVTIRALYKLTNGAATYYVDPSTYMESTHIAPSDSLRLYLPSGVLLNQQEKIVAATENGVKTKDEYVPPVTPTPTSSHNPHKYIYGNLELTWVEFQYKNVTGQFNPNPIWGPGWVVPPSQTVAWKVTLKNIGDRDITITENSSFTTVATGFPGHPTSVSSLLNWFLWSTPSGQLQQTLLKADPTVPATPVYFVWNTPGGNKYQGTYSQSCVCMAFLTFFGYFNDDGSPYAQTVPFEAAITIS
jgi:hypothetical protein